MARSLKDRLIVLFLSERKSSERLCFFFIAASRYSGSGVIMMGMLVSVPFLMAISNFCNLFMVAGAVPQGTKTSVQSRFSFRPEEMGLPSIVTVLKSGHGLPSFRSAWFSGLNPRFIRAGSRL